MMLRHRMVSFTLADRIKRSQNIQASPSLCDHSQDFFALERALLFLLISLMILKRCTITVL